MAHSPVAGEACVSQQPDTPETWLSAAQRLLDTRYSLDRDITWGLLVHSLLLTIYGSFSGVTQELAALGSGYKGFNIAGFPHQEALKLGSWIVLGLVLLLMLGNYWDRRSGKYLLGALAVLAATIPLLAGQFESQIATATAWRFLAALFFLGASLVLWYRSAISRRLKTFGWPDFDADNSAFKKQAIGLLIVLTVLPLLLFTIYPALRAIYYLPVQGPVSGLFSWLGDDVSYGLPLVLVALVMIGYALRERMTDFAFYAGVLFNATVTLAFLLAVVSANGLMDRVVLVRRSIECDYRRSLHACLVEHSAPLANRAGSQRPALRRPSAEGAIGDRRNSEHCSVCASDYQSHLGAGEYRHRNCRHRQFVRLALLPGECCGGGVVWRGPNNQSLS